MRKVYLDNNATTRVHPEVIDIMNKCLGEIYGNASSIHHYGQDAHGILEEARQEIADLIGAKPEEVVFTSGGTESDNLALKGIALANSEKGKHIITSPVEHHAILNSCKHLEQKGFKVTYLKVDEHGIINPAEVEQAITGETVLISVMTANNETGAVQPIAEIGKIARDKGIVFHSDAVQAVGKIPVNVNAMNVDALSFSGHKFYGPKGIGVLYLRTGTGLEPLVHGGHHEKSRRAGTENIPAIAGLAKALEIAQGDLASEAVRIAGLRDMLYNGLKDRIENIHLMGPPGNRVPNTLNICFEFVEGESIILNLDMKGIAVSSGSACASGSLSASHVLNAMGVDPALAQGSVRFSLGRFNTEEDVEYAIEVLPDIVERIRSMSPLYNSKK